MSYQNIFYLGHFEISGDFAVVEKTESSPLVVPKVKQAIDGYIVFQHAAEFSNEKGVGHEDWDIKVANGMVVFAAFSQPMVLEWALKLSKEMQLDIVDGAMRLVPLAELQEMAGAK